MVLDIANGIAKPLALLLSILSLYSTFHAAFLTPTSLEDRIHHALLRLAAAAVVSTLGALLFRDTDPRQYPRTRLADTLPMQLFRWAATGIVVLFAVSWYLETYVILYRDVR